MLMFNFFSGVEGVGLVFFCERLRFLLYLTNLVHTLLIYSVWLIPAVYVLLSCA